MRGRDVREFGSALSVQRLGLEGTREFFWRWLLFHFVASFGLVSQGLAMGEGHLYLFDMG